MRRLKQALWGFLRPIRARAHTKMADLVFHASTRAIKETHWMVEQSAHDSALRAINQALAAYEPPTPWAEEWVNEVTQVLDSVISEQFRLQSQVEELERLFAEALRQPAVADGGRETWGNG